MRQDASVKRLLIFSLLLMSSMVGCQREQSPCEQAIEGLRARMAAEKLKAAKEHPITPDLLEQVNQFEKAALSAMGARCRTDKWSDEMLKCLGDATDSPKMERCRGLLTPEQSKQMATAMMDQLATFPKNSPSDLARIEAKKLAFEAFPQWAVAHPDKACPERLEDLLEYLPSKDSQDPWGKPFRMLCGAGLPPGAKGIASSPMV
jgi:hypothetical protein